MNRLLSSCLLFLFFASQVAQGADRGDGVDWGSEYYRSPVGFAITMAGNVGEIRGDRFHMGIDVKALQGVGSPVYSVAQGYISRIGVSPTGYGLVLYVTHPNNEVSVYGHLDSFVPKVAGWVREQQYEKRSYRVDLYPDKEQFPVKKGEQIGSLGNTGSSGGPHLHLEIRTADGHPRNMIAQGIYKVGDRVSPTVNRVLLFEVDTVWIELRKQREAIPVHRLKQSFPVHRNEDGIYVTDSVFRMEGSGYLAYETIDFKDGKTNTMGIYSIRQRVDGEMSMHWAIDYLTYASTRYAATLISYAESKSAGRYTVLRSYLSPNNGLPIYKQASSRGIVSAPADAAGLRNVETDIVDEAGNVSQVQFQIRRDPETRCGYVEDSIKSRKAVRWNTAFRHVAGGLMVSIPSGALYESAMLPFGYDSVRNAVRVGLEELPLLKPISVSIAAPEIPERLQSKALLVQVSQKDHGREVISSRGGSWQQIGIQARVSSFGYYRVMVDTIPPVIRPAFKSGGQIPAGRRLRFTVTDNLSGIVGYSIRVDGQWELLAYDPKNRAVEYEPARASRQVLAHDVELSIVDARNNRRIWKGKYLW